MLDCLRAQKAEKLHKVHLHVLEFQIKGTGMKKDLLVIARLGGLNPKSNGGLLMDAKCPASV